MSTTIRRAQRCFVDTVNATVNVHHHILLVEMELECGIGMWKGENGKWKVESGKWKAEKENKIAGFGFRR